MYYSGGSHGSEESKRIQEIRDPHSLSLSEGTLKFYLEDRELMHDILQGELLFRRIADDCGLGAFANVSKVHGGDDIFLQAKLLALMESSPQIRKTISCLTFGSHLFDDLLDPPEHIENRRLFSRDRLNFDIFLKRNNPLSELGNRLCDLSENPEGVKKTLQRIAYTSLVIHADSKDIPALARENMDMGMAGVETEVAQIIRRNIDPYFYSFTSKGAQELAESTRKCFNMTRSEIWTLIYTSAILFHDLEEEVSCGEMPDIQMNDENIGKLQAMIDTGSELIAKYETDKPGRLLQFRAVQHNYSPLYPDPLKDAIRNVVKNLIS